MRAYMPEATQGATRFSGGTFGSTLYGVITVNPGVANTKSAWVEVIAATAHDGMGLFVNIRMQSATWSQVDIGIGAAGSEKVFIPNLFGGSSLYQPLAVYLPIRVPAGSRLSVRSQTDSTIGVVGANLIVVGGDMRWARMPRCSTIGVNTATTHGTPITLPAVAGTKGVWVELSSALPHDFHYCVLMTGTTNGRQSSQQYFLDIGVGGSGAERAVLSNLSMVDPHTTGDIWCPYALALPLYLPSGSRVSARIQASGIISTVAPEIALLGVDA